MAQIINDLVDMTQTLVPDASPNEARERKDTLQILMIGNPQQNLFGIWNEILGGIDPLDFPLMADYRGTIAYGQSPATFWTETSTIIPTSLEDVSSTLKPYRKESVQHCFTVLLPHPLLKECTIHVLGCASIENVNWNAELSNCDYFLLTMNSIALLSLSERKIIRNWLVPYASSAYGVILTNHNLILGKDREDIEISLKSIFEGSVPIFRTPGQDEKKLSDMLEGLKKNASATKAQTRKRAERLMLVNAKKAIEIQREIFSKNKVDAQAAIEAIQKTVKYLSTRQKAAFRHSKILYLSPTRLEAIQWVDAFQEKLGQKLHEEIEKAEDARKIAAILPSYIADAWKREGDALLEAIQKQVNAMQKDLQLYIEKDFRNYLEDCIGGKLTDYVYALTESYLPIQDPHAKEEKRTFLYDAPKDNTSMKYYGTIASGIALILCSHPLIGITVATIGSSEVKKRAQWKLNEDTKEALLPACEALNSDWGSDRKRWIDEVFLSIEKNIETAVGECYQKMTDQVVEALQHRMTDQNTYEEKLKELEALQKEIDSKLAILS